MLIARLHLAERLFDIIMEMSLAESSAFAGALGGISTYSLAFVFAHMHSKLNSQLPIRGCKLPVMLTSDTQAGCLLVKPWKGFVG